MWSPSLSDYRGEGLRRSLRSCIKGSHVASIKLLEPNFDDAMSLRYCCELEYVYAATGQIVQWWEIAKPVTLILNNAGMKTKNGLQFLKKEEEPRVGGRFYDVSGR